MGVNKTQWGSGGGGVITGVGDPAGFQDPQDRDFQDLKWEVLKLASSLSLPIESRLNNQDHWFNKIP